MLRKESKIYLYDWVEIENEGFCFENLVAFHLFKATRLWEKPRGKGLTRGSFSDFIVFNDRSYLVYTAE